MVQTRRARAYARLLTITARLPCETVGMVSTFLDAKSVGWFVVAVLPSVDRPTLAAFLHRNFPLLEQHCKTQPTLFRLFLEINDDWRTLYDEANGARNQLSNADKARFDSIFGNVPLLIETGRVDILRHLFEERNFDVNEEYETQDMNGTRCLPIDISMVLGDEKTTRYILSIPKIEVRDLVVTWVRASKTRHLRTMLSCPNINVNDTGPFGMNGLHKLYVSPGPDIQEIVERTSILIENGIDINMFDKFGFTPLHRCIICWNFTPGFVPVAKILIENGADPNCQRGEHEGGTDKRTPLECAGNGPSHCILGWVHNKKRRLTK